MYFFNFVPPNPVQPSTYRIARMPLIMYWLKSRNEIHVISFTTKEEIMWFLSVFLIEITTTLSTWSFRLTSCYWLSFLLLKKRSTNGPTTPWIVLTITKEECLSLNNNYGVKMSALHIDLITISFAICTPSVQTISQEGRSRL